MLEEIKSKFMFFPDLSNVMRKKNLINSFGLIPLQMLLPGNIMDRSCHKTCHKMSQEHHNLHCFCLRKPKKAGKKPPLHTSKILRSSKCKEPLVLLFVHGLCLQAVHGCRLLNKHAIKNPDCKAKYLIVLRCLNRSWLR